MKNVSNRRGKIVKIPCLKLFEVSLEFRKVLQVLLKTHKLPSSQRSVIRNFKIPI